MDNVQTSSLSHHKPNEARVLVLTKVTVGQAFEQTGLLTTRGTADGGCEVGDVSLCDLEGHLTAAAHGQLGPLAWLTGWGTETTKQSSYERRLHHRLLILT